jgi:hypothetical protein
MHIFDASVKDIYKRASYLKCFKEDFMLYFRETSKVSINNNIEKIPPPQVQQGTVTTETTQLNTTITSAPGLSKQGTSTKILIEDPAISMMRNIMKFV